MLMCGVGAKSVAHLMKFHLLEWEVIKVKFLMNSNTVEPQLSEPHGRHIIRPDNRGVRIDEGNRNSRSMGYPVGDN